MIGNSERWRVRERSAPATIETARQGAAPPRGGGEEEGEGEGGAGIDPVSMGAVRLPRRVKNRHGGPFASAVTGQRKKEPQFALCSGGRGY